MSSSHPNQHLSTEHSQTRQNHNKSLRYDPLQLIGNYLTSYESSWINVSLEYSEPPAGEILKLETPKLCFDHYVIGICFGQGYQVDLQIDGIANGLVQRHTTFSGEIVLVPMKHHNWACLSQRPAALTLNLKTELLTRNAAELLAIEQVELLPYSQINDPLIVQIGIALKADLDSQKLGGRLYAETMATSLAVHLVRNYSSHHHKSIHLPSGLSPTILKQVLDYINDHLEQDLSLEELASIAQISLYHFCRSFKQSTGFAPHQYVIRQRVERAKLLLKGGKMGVLEVALVCGFTHQSHLNRHFKRLTGVTPKNFSKS